MRLYVRLIEIGSRRKRKKKIAHLNNCIRGARVWLSTDTSDSLFCAHFTIAFDMEQFRKNYTVYYHVLYITGLWPYDQTLLAKVQRVGFSLLILSCIGIQVSTIKFVDLTLFTMLQLLAFLFPILLIFLRYVGFIANFPVIRECFDNIENDCGSMNNPVEANIIVNQIIEAKRVIFALLVISFGAIFLATTVLLIPGLLQLPIQIRFLNVIGFFYPERSLETDYICCHIFLVASLGVLALVGTESALAVLSSYLCGLFEIASYRIENSVNALAQVENQKGLIDIRSAVSLHQRAIKYATDVTKNMMLSYLIAILTVIVSFAVNLYRFYLAVLNIQKVDNFVISLQIFAVHILIMFLNNYTGQRLMNTSVEVFHKTYNSLWYRIPPKSQKMLLFVLMKSVTEVQFNVVGLFIPCFEGFSMMMSSSFSYFTVLISF